MLLLYKAPRKEILQIRNKIFLENGIPPLTKNGFERSPYSSSWYGKDDFGGFSYQLCRLNSNGDLITIKIYIINGERWVQIFLNIFRLEPKPESLKQLNGLEGLAFGVPPNSRTNMRLRMNDRKGPPILHIFEKQHKLEPYYTKNGFDRSVKKLTKLIERDMNNIDYYIQRWYDIYKQPMKTTWEGLPIT
jgi:hypothetical protein